MAEGLNQDIRMQDTLRPCIGQLAERFGMPFVQSHLGGLALDAKGLLPLHQAEAALELVGLNCDVSRDGKLPRRAEFYPAIVDLGDEGCIVAHEWRDGDLLVWRPGSNCTQWEPLKAIEQNFSGWMASVFGDSTAVRQEGQPWETAARTHWFWSEVYKVRREFTPVLVATLIINLLALALPLFSMNVYDRVIPNRAAATLWVLASGVAVAFVLDYALRRARTKVLDNLGRELDLKLSQKIFAKILAAPMADRKGQTGNLVARVTEYASVREFFTSTTIVLVVDLAFLVLFVILIAYLASWLAFIPMIAIAVMAVLGFRLQHKVHRAAIEAQADHGLQQTLLVESVTGLETLKSLSGEGVMLGRWRQLAELGARSQERLRDISSAAIGLASTAQQACNVALIVGGYYLFDAGQITMGAIIAIVMLSSRSLSPAAQLAYLLTRAQQSRQTLESIQQLWDGDDERRKGSASFVPVVRSADLKLENLSFTYPGAQLASLDSINLTVKPGDRVALIGRVASGKSTLGRLLCGLYEPSDGAMMVGGIDSRQFRPQDLRAAFRFVGQDAAHFTGTIKDNLMLGASGASEADLVAALQAIGADQFLSRDAGGFDRSVGENGVRLSGGQRSFLSISRALVASSKLLFLDEPTGAMDSQTEKHFVERLSSYLTPQHTLIISTHRPALFALCNRIVVLDNGRIVADGSRDEILAGAGAGAAGA